MVKPHHLQLATKNQPSWEHHESFGLWCSHPEESWNEGCSGKKYIIRNLGQAHLPVFAQGFLVCQFHCLLKIRSGSTDEPWTHDEFGNQWLKLVLIKGAKLLALPVHPGTLLVTPQQGIQSQFKSPPNYLSSLFSPIIPSELLSTASLKLKSGEPCPTEGNPFAKTKTGQAFLAEWSWCQDQHYRRWCSKNSLPGGDIDFQNPWLEILIQHDIKPKQLMAAVRAPHIQLHKIDYIRLRPRRWKQVHGCYWARTSFAWDIACPA